jgi:hypothetical protein
MRSPARRATAHAAAVVLAYGAVFSWLFSRILTADAYLAESDLYDWFLPLFLSPPARWTSAMLAGLPSFADTSDAAQYPVQIVLRAVGAWDAYVVSGYVLAASFTYAYVWCLTRSAAAAAIGGLAFGLSEALVERQAHINFVHAFAWLPLVLLAVERLLRGASVRWAAVGAFGLASCFLAGHPQPFLYAAAAALAYAATGAIAEGVARAVLARLAVLFVVGGGLAAIKALPFLEATGFITRSTVSYAQFIANSHTPAQMLGVLFPVIEHNGREAPLYVGLGVLMLASVGAWVGRRDWRVRVWLAIAVAVLLIGAGDATPAAALAHRLPGFDRFRVSTRMLFLFAFAAATLAGMGMRALSEGGASRKAMLTSVIGVSAAVLAGAAVLTQPLGLSFEPRSLAWHLPVWPAGIWAQLAIALASAVAVLWMTRARSRIAAVSVAVVIGADLVYSLPYDVSWNGIAPIVVHAAALRPSIHARELGLTPSGQRLLAIGGTTRDALVPAGFARLWNIPIAGGYSPIVLANLAELARMGGNGDVRTHTLAIEDRSLDLLAVRYAAVREDDFPDSGTFEREGISWSRAGLDLPVGRPDCGHSYPRTRTIDLPADVSAAAIALVAHLRCAEEVPHGVEVGAIEVTDRAGGRVARLPLRAGLEIADRSLSDPAVRARAGHGPARVFADPSLPANVYFVRVNLPASVRAGRLQLHGAAIEGWLTLERLTVIDHHGGSHPQELGPLLMGSTERWRTVKRLRTSRTTDRISDEDAPGELGFTIYENLRALPRAWVVTETIEATDDQAVHAIRYSQLPGGAPFDPMRQALVPPGTGRVAFPAGASSARVVALSDGAVSFDVSTSAGGYLVSSEMFYPGWRARVDGRPADLHRTNLALQGVRVPAGRHRVELELASASLAAGRAISSLAVGVALWLLCRR